MQMASDRLVHWFRLPAGMSVTHKGMDLVRFGVIELTVQEELTAAKMADQSAYALANRTVMMAVRYAKTADGQVVEFSLADESAESLWAAMGPKVRTLLLQAHVQVNTPKQDETASFLSSCEVSVG